MTIIFSGQQTAKLQLQHIQICWFQPTLLAADRKLVSPWTHNEKQVC